MVVLVVVMGDMLRFLYGFIVEDMFVDGECINVVVFFVNWEDVIVNCFDVCVNVLFGLLLLGVFWLLDLVVYINGVLVVLMVCSGCDVVG